MSTPGSHITSIVRKLVSPMMYCSGSPFARRTTAVCIAASSSLDIGLSKFTYISVRESPVTPDSSHSADRRGRSSPRSFR